MNKKKSKNTQIQIDLDNLSYEDALEELEKIMTNLQEDSVHLTDMRELYIKGKLYLNYCISLLEDFEQEINEIKDF